MFPQNMALYGTVPPFQDPEIPIEMGSLEIMRLATRWGPQLYVRCFVNPATRVDEIYPINPHLAQISIKSL